jgi:hypothetical protein
VSRLVPRGIACLLAALVVTIEPAFSQGPEPYSLRGIHLGILLADFKIMPARDSEVWPDAKPFCSDDPVGAASATAVSKSEAAAGFVRCGIFDAGAGGPEMAGLIVAGIKTDAAFIFVPDYAGAMRLAWIRATAASSDYGKIRAALLSRYGPPKTTMRGYAYDAAGAKLVDETTVWSNDVSTIRLDQREEKIDVQMMSLDYNHEALTAEGLKRLKAVTKNAADQL